MTIPTDSPIDTPTDSPTETPTDTPTGDASSGSPSSPPAASQRRITRALSGAAGLGAAGMLLLGVVILTTDDTPPVEDGLLGELVIRDGLHDDAPTHPLLTDFPMTGPPANDDVIVGSGSGADVLIGHGGRSDDVLIGDPAIDDPIVDDIIVSDAIGTLPGITEFCARIEHASPPGMEDSARSGIWVWGTLSDGVTEGWIRVSGPSLNGGAPTDFPVVAGGFSGPLGINSYGDHPIETFELHIDGQVPIDLRPSILDRTGAILPVGPDEGPVFGDECMQVEPPAAPAPPLDASVADVGDADEASVADAGDADEAPVADVGEADVVAFFEAFADAHRTGDIGYVWDRLHPVAVDVHGEAACRTYVEDTLGSIDTAIVHGVHDRGPWDFTGPDRVVTFPDMFTVTVDLVTPDGRVFTNEAHLPIEDGQLFWLSTCGADAP